ncbi:hypothetical protein [Paenibacillus tundrae]|uniref:hypothetical protein n=1 Tax=Paenibacillus tundrae TaxID=528187 RepID=UPI0022A9E69D|nr:hypothetical protein [Paenibacillus tundrae]
MVGGHQRYKNMVNELDHTELQVSVVDLDDQQERLLNIVLNKVAGRWDDEALGRLLGELQADGTDMVISGFNQEEFEDLIAEFGTVSDTEIEVPIVRMILTSKVRWTISSSLRHNGAFDSLVHID